MLPLGIITVKSIKDWHKNWQLYYTVWVKSNETTSDWKANSFDGLIQWSQSGREMCFFHRVTSLIKSESVISEWRVVSAYQIIMVNKLWVYLAWIYISHIPSSPPLPPSLSLSVILFVSQCLANFALGCNFASQENAPLLHNLVSRATVVIQLQSEMPRGVNPQSDAVQMKSPPIPQPFKCNELVHQITVHKREHWVQSPTKWMEVNSRYDKYILVVIQGCE